MSLKHVVIQQAFLYSATSFAFCLEIPGSISASTIRTYILLTLNQKQETFKTDRNTNSSPSNPQSKITKES